MVGVDNGARAVLLAYEKVIVNTNPGYTPLPPGMPQLSPVNALSRCSGKQGGDGKDGARVGARIPDMREGSIRIRRKKRGISNHGLLAVTDV